MKYSVQCAIYKLLATALTLAALRCLGQGTLTITFDGPPLPTSQSLYTSYVESGMRFEGFYNGFGRVPSGLFPTLPDDGTAYLQGDGHSGYNAIGGSFLDGSTFGVASVDLAACGGGYNDISAVFGGWRPDGTHLTLSVSGTGIDFRTISFGPEWSSGLTLFGVFNANDSPDGWSVDNLVVIVPEPGTGALFSVGALTFSFWQSKRRKV